MFTKTDNCPAAILKAIRSLTDGDGTLNDVARALGVDSVSFQETMTWYLLDSDAGMTDLYPDYQTMVNFVLLHFIRRYREEIGNLRKRVAELERKNRAPWARPQK